MVVSHCLDTNLLVYAFSKAPRDAAKKRIARDWLSREDWGVTVQVLQEFYVNAVRAPHGLGHDDALALIEEIASSRPVAAIDIPLMRHALQLKSRYRISYWDAAAHPDARRAPDQLLLRRGEPRDPVRHLRIGPPGRAGARGGAAIGVAVRAGSAGRPRVAGGDVCGVRQMVTAHHTDANGLSTRTPP